MVNVITPLMLAFVLVLSGWPRTKLEEGSSIQTLHDRIVDVLRKVSISQTWRMYAPDPARGHYYMVLETYDRDGTKRVQEESVKVETGWGTSWAWSRTRKDIWLHAIMRGIDKTNRNRTWYMRGVCMREARRGRDARRVSVSRVY